MVGGETRAPSRSVSENYVKSILFFGRRTVILYRYYHIKISSTKLLIITHHYITISKSLFEAQHQILLIIMMLSQTTRHTGQYILYYPTVSECDNIIEPLPVR